MINQMITKIVISNLNFIPIKFSETDPAPLSYFPKLPIDRSFVIQYIIYQSPI